MAEQIIDFTVDKELYEKVLEIYQNMGLNLETVLNLFMEKSLLAGGFPFDVNLSDTSFFKE